METSNKTETNVNKDSKVFTSLVDKHHSPLLIRKYTHWGFPIYVGCIVDQSLSDLDDFVVGFMKKFAKDNWTDDIQKLRNLAGTLTAALVDHYETSEGIAVVFYMDKAFISSLHGDFMNHTSCRIEFYGLLQMSAHV